MERQALAVKYRPHDWDSVVEQESIKIILKQQLDTHSFKSAYLFCGGAGTGKTTCARIFANEINHGQGNPIELDAASNNGVDDVRNIIQQAQTKSLNSEYKCFIIDECHAISNAGWQAMLKLIEEPPAKSIFIFCTTDPQKIPKTILSRVQRYDFKRISQNGIVQRLKLILECEQQDHTTDWEHHTERPNGWPEWTDDALEYISKLSEGGMRDAISLMDKCLSFSDDLTLENVVKALGTTDYDVMLDLTDSLTQSHTTEMIEIIENIYSAGKDIKTFIKSYLHFLLDVEKYFIGCDWKYINIPKIQKYQNWLDDFSDDDVSFTLEILNTVLKLNADIKYSATPKQDIEAVFLVLIEGNRA